MATECSWNDGSKAQYYIVILDRLLGRSGGLEQAPEWRVRGPLTNTPQGIANALGYLQYYFQELMERQHVSENNINTTLAALTMQLQQLTQLVANPPLSAVLNTPPPPILSPLTSPSSALTA